MDFRRLVLGLSLSLAFVARAESLEEKKMHKEEERQLQEIVKTTNDRCGTKVTATIDWKSYKAEEAANKSPSSFCAAPLEAMQSLCSEEDPKAAIQKHIKKISCKYVGAGKRSVKVSAGTLTWDAEWNAANDTEYIKDYFMKHLD